MLVSHSGNSAHQLRWGMLTKDWLVPSLAPYADHEGCMYDECGDVRWWLKEQTSDGGKVGVSGKADSQATSF